MKQRHAAVKGMYDILPSVSNLWCEVERVARELFQAYGYGELRTPIVEETGLFVHGVGEQTEIVQKEMYTFDDRSGRSISLRPEGTAPAVRSYIEHGIAQTESLTRWFYLGPMFRYERMKTGRYRQFYQIGAEAFGSAEPSQDVELIALAHELLRRLGIPDVKLHLNTLGDPSTRPSYIEALRVHFAEAIPNMSEEARATFARNPLRLLDTKETALHSLVASAPSLIDFIDAPAREHYDEVRRLLTRLGIPFKEAPKLVRGLDYYTRTTFEFIYESSKENGNALGTAGTVCGGGRYDGLVEVLGGPARPAIGFAAGLDRLVLLLQATRAVEPNGPLLVIGHTEDATAQEEAFVLAMALRGQGLRVDFAQPGRVGRQTERANKARARYFMVLGSTELERGTASLKELISSASEEVPLASLREWLGARR